MDGVVDGCDDPRNSETEEDIDRVAPGDVADRVVGVLLVHGRHLGDDDDEEEDDGDDPGGHLAGKGVRE